MNFRYPPTRRSAAADSYHGCEVADPYRWLEEPASEETAAFVTAQNAISEPYIRSLPKRGLLHERMTELWDVPRTSPPTVRNGISVWAHNDGLQDQPVWYVHREGEEEPSVFLDPNTMSDDGAVAVIVTSLSPDGQLFAYTVAESGSDLQRLHIRSTKTRDDLDDVLHHLRFTSIAWHRNGFFYNRFPEVDPESTEPLRDPTVHYHRIGDPQDADRLVFHNDNDPEPSYAPTVTHDDAYLVLSEYLGTSRRNGLLYLDLRNGLADGLTDGEPVPADRWTRLVDPEVALNSFVLHLDDGFILHTDHEAPNGSIVHVPLHDRDARTTVIAEGSSVIGGVGAVAGQLLVVRLVDGSHTIERATPTGEILGQIELPGLGSIDRLSGRFDDDCVYFGYQSFVDPPSVLSWRQGTTEPFDPTATTRKATSRGGIAAEVVVERRYATSTDGQQVGMFVVRLADTALPGPVELYGYGGFSIDMTPTYSPARLAFLESGGIVAVANLRGGTELGEVWHEQGKLGNKQQVFDDFGACGQQLIDDGITTPGQLGIRGGSNGGLLTAVLINQQPDLLGAVVSQVPVTDMLRYQLFTAGRYWAVEYGQASDPDAFQWLISYSPLHNVGEADTYPPLLITTAESDDRVVPMHAYKFAAEVQHRAGGESEQPLLLRVETRAGHGLGKPTAKIIEESADIYAFLLHHLKP